MKSTLRLAKMTLPIVLVCVFCQISDGAAIREQIAALHSSGQVSDLGRIVRDLEKLYVSNLPSYISNRVQLDSTLELLANTNIEARAALKAQIHLVLAKEIQTTNPESATLLFNLKEASVRQLVRISSSGLERETGQSLVRFLGEIRSATITNFQRLKGFDNVAPPLSGGGPMHAGMNPDVIPDLKARAAYRAAIEANNNNYFQNRLQLDILPRLNEFVTGLVLDVLKTKAGERGFFSEELARLADIAHLSLPEKQIIGFEERE